VVTTVCLYVLTSPFIKLWIGEDMLLAKGVLILLCIDFYFIVTRQICLSFTNATGLFVKDRFRPLIQSVINLAVSVVLAKHIGLAGVFVGTIVSYMVTVFWREPWILFKNYFCRSSLEYWFSYALFALIAIADCLLVSKITENIPQNILGWIITGIIAVVISAITIVLLTFKSDEYRYYLNLIKRKIRRI
jgi:O-antigen/teichoic acid export membrane protein